MHTPRAQEKISIIIPIFLGILLIASIVAIIANSILLSSSITLNENNFPANGFQTDGWRIFKITLSSIIAIIIFITFALSLLELTSPGNYQPKIFTPSLDSKIWKIYEEMESWELLLIVSTLFVFPIGLAKSLIVDDTAFLFIGIAIIIVVYYTYTTRLSLRAAIRDLIPKQKEISLKNFSKMLSKDQKDVKNAILYLIRFDNFPMSYDPATKMIVYSQLNNPVDVPVVTPVIENHIKPTTQDEYKGISCPYCGEPPAVLGAKFCQECGSSIIPAK